ncbi:MAG: Omp28-related outer membrane protein [Bacteroidales bacterium]
MKTQKITITAFIFFLICLSANTKIFAQKVNRNLSVVEIATATWCGYCPGAAMAAEDLVNNGDKVAIIEYHGNDKYSNQESTNRINFYNITGFPTARFDGSAFYVGGDPNNSVYSTYKPEVDKSLAKKTSFTFKINATKTADHTYKVVLRSEKVDSYTSSGDLAFVLVVTESKIPFKWKNQTELNFVSRKVIPNANGEKLKFSSNVEERTFTVNLDPSWNENNIEFVGLLQNTDKSKYDILNAAKVKTTEKTPTGLNNISRNTDSETNVWANSNTKTATVEYSSDKDCQAEIYITDLNGKQIANKQVKITSGKNTIQLQSDQLQTGVLISVIKFADGKSINTKFICK